MVHSVTSGRGLRQTEPLVPAPVQHEPRDEPVARLPRAALAGVEVQVRKGESTISGPDGRFEARVAQWPGPTPRRTVAASHPGYLLEQHDVPEGVHEVRLELRPGAVLRGRVEVGGQPVAQGRLLLDPESTGRGQFVEFWDGHYTVGGLPAGPYVLYLLEPGQSRPTAWNSPHRVSLSLGEHATVDVLDPEPSHTRVEVLVAERTLEVHLLPGRVPLLGPAQGLSGLLAQGVMGRTVREGTRRFSNLPAGPYTLLAIRRDETGTEVHREELDVTEGESTFTLVPQWHRFEDEPSAERP